MMQAQHEYVWFTKRRLTGYLTFKFRLTPERCGDIWEFYDRRLSDAEKRINSKGEREFKIRVLAALAKRQARNGIYA